MSEEFTLEAGRGISNWLKCACGNQSEGYCIIQGNYDGRTHDPDADSWTISHYKILRCLACEGITIFRYTAFDKAINHEYLEPRELKYYDYTEEILFSPAKKRHLAIPLAVADVISQAERVVPASPRAAFVLCRAALEEICSERGVEDTRTNDKGRTIFISLKDRMEILFQRENLPTDLQKIMHGIKDLGNTGAHGAQIALTDTISAEEVQHLLELLDYTLECLYVDKARAIEAEEKLNALKAKVLG